MSVRVAVAGATGKLGSLVCQFIEEDPELELTGAVVSRDGGHVGTVIHGVTAVGPDSIDDVLAHCDVYVDLTAPKAAEAVIGKVAGTGVGIVLGTTAVGQDALDAMAAGVRKSGGSAVVSANFAIGVNVFWKMCEEMAKYLPDYDVEVIEMHHNQKKDSPSGTAMEAVRRLQAVTETQRVVYGREGVTGPRQREIGVHSIRAGDIVGDHTVLFAKNMERLELTHRLVSREALARGCIQTIKWVASRKDGEVHSMSEVLGLC